MENSSGKLTVRLEEVSAAKEKLGIEFDLYTQLYRDSLRAILETIRHNKQESSQERNVFHGEGRNYIAPLRRSNIIAFIGDRGAGKTTAINEFCELLYEFDEKREAWEKETSCENIGDLVKRFYMLPPIDASVLGEKEDLIEVILASMYQNFQDRAKKERYNQEVFEKEIIHEFDRAYKDYIDVARGEKQITPGETVLVKLSNVSNSLKARTAFDRLIKKFLKYMCGEKSEKTYLVITVDDLDMNPKNGYEMLEQLHKYLENLGVIILIAIKYEQINIISQKHFVNCLISEYGSTHKAVYDKVEKVAKGLSNDYLLKLLPLSNRVYLPEKGRLYLEGTVSYQKSEEEFRVKEFILGKVASKMNIYYDADGLKKHFCLPNTVRELVSYVSFLDSLLSMKEIEKEKNGKKRVLLYDRNHDRFNDDIENRMALQLLNDDQLEQYQLIMGRNIERRAEYTVNFIKLWINNKEEDSKKLLSDRVDDSNYCYADLLETLYYLGRVDYEDKVLVHCILASFTAEMVREYYSYQNNTDPEKKKRAANRLECFRGKTFGGHWFDEIIPVIRMNESVDIIIGDRVSFSERCKKSYREEWIGYPLGREIELLWAGREDISEETDKMVALLTGIVPYMECLSLLFYDFRDGVGRPTASKWKFRIKRGVTSQGERISLNISNEAKYAKFDFLGFMGRELEGAGTVKYGQGLHEKIVGSLKTSLSEYLGNDLTLEMRENAFRKIEVKAREKSIWTKTELEQKSAREAIFPYYNLDMAYNVMKRVRKKIKGSGRIESENFCDYLRGIYGYIAQYLKREEEFYTDYYKKGIDKMAVPKFYNSFINSPFIKAFGVKYLENLTKERIDETKIGGTLENKRMMNWLLLEMVKGMLANTIDDFKGQHDKVED